MHAHQHFNLALLAAPDEGFPGIPGAGPSGGSGGLPGIPGGGPSGIPGSGSSSGSTPAPATGHGWGAPAPMPGDGDGGAAGQPQFARPEPQHSSGGMGPVFELAGWGQRFAAWLADAIIVAILSVPLIALASAAGIDVGDSTRSGSSASFNAANGQALTLGLLFVIVVAIYAPLTMLRMDGATVGKRMVGIRVVRADGLPIGLPFVLLREVLLKNIVIQAVSFVTIGLAGLLNYLWPLWDSENRAVHDMAAKSRVVKR